MFQLGWNIQGLHRKIDALWWCHTVICLRGYYVFTCQFLSLSLLDECFLMFCILVFVFSLVLWHEWPMVMVTSESSGLVGVSLGDLAACMASRVLCTSLVSSRA